MEHAYCCRKTCPHELQCKLAQVPKTQTNLPTYTSYSSIIFSRKLLHVLHLNRYHHRISRFTHLHMPFSIHDSKVARWYMKKQSIILRTVRCFGYNRLFIPIGAELTILLSAENSLLQVEYVSSSNCKQYLY
jgi:hypothetical protein